MIPTLYIIAGPTAVGKTAVAISLAQRLDTSIVSADSRQCYKEMTIGTSKPRPGELLSIKHYFIDEFPVTAHITAAGYEVLALKYLTEIFKKQDAAVVCGGTGLYIKALCDGLDEMPHTDIAIIQKVEEEYKQKGLEWLQQAAQQEDPAFYSSAETQNPVRLIRALSFKRSTGDSISKYKTGIKKPRPFRIIKIGLQLPRELLYKRINERVDEMITQGLQEEVERLLPYRDHKNLQSVGYTELFEFLDGKATLPEAIEKIKQHTRNYAKRQMTWFNKDKEFTWLRADDANVVEQILKM